MCVCVCACVCVCVCWRERGQMGREKKSERFFVGVSLSIQKSSKLRAVSPVRLPGPRGELAVVLPEPAARVDGEAVGVFLGRERESKGRGRRLRGGRKRSKELKLKNRVVETNIRSPTTPVDTASLQLHGEPCLSCNPSYRNGGQRKGHRSKQRTKEIAFFSREREKNIDGSSPLLFFLFFSPYVRPLRVGHGPRVEQVDAIKGRVRRGRHD